MQRFAALALCAALALSFTGCAVKSPATVLAVDGADIPAGLYLAYQYQNYTTASSKVTDGTKLLKATIEEKPAADWIHDETVSACARYAWINKEFEAQGLKFSDEENATMAEQIASGYESGKDLLAANGIGQASYGLFYTAEAKYQKLYDAYAEKNPVQDAEAKAYMDETYARVRTLMLPVTDANAGAVDDETKTKINAVADELVKKLEGDKDLAELAPDALKKAMELSGREYADNSTDTYLSASFVKEGATSSFPAEFVTLVRASKIGAAGKYELYGTPTVYQRIANYADDTEFAQYRDAIVSEIQSSAFEAYVKEEAAKLSVQEDASAVKTYSVKKVVTSLT